MEPIDHFGVEAATDHRQKNPSVRLARVEAHRGAGGQRLGHRDRVGRQLQVIGQQIRGAQRIHRQRDVGRGAIDDFGHGAIATGGNDGPQLTGRAITLDQLFEHLQIADQFGGHSSIGQRGDELTDEFPALPGTGRGIDHDQHPQCGGWDE